MGRSLRWPHAGCGQRRCEGCRKRRSVELLQVGPARKPGDGIELPQQLSYQLLGAITFAELVELSDHARQRRIGVGDRALREILALKRETFAVADELTAIKVSGASDRGARNPIGADACHASP